MSSPAVKGNPEDARKMRERAEYDHAMAVVGYDRSLTDGAAALSGRDALARLASAHPEDYERLRNAVIAFEAEMLNEENPEAADALGF